MKHISETAYAEYFENAALSASILVASEDEARAMWARMIDAAGRAYFRLPNDAWIVTGNSVKCGRWMEDLNASNPTPFRQLLRSTAPWHAEQQVIFAASPAIALLCDWHTFTEHWIGFLLIESDCSILVSGGGGKQAFVFRALGDANFVGEKTG
jgi:hypothetical protein